MGGPSRLRVALLSDHEQSGGASIAATRLADGLADVGHEVVRVFDTPSATPSGVSIGRRRLRPNTAIRALDVGLGRVRPRRLRPALERLYAQPRERSLARRLERLLAELAPDVINVHNLHGARGWTVDLLEVCARAAPTAWTLHDCWSFTGRCAYFGPCERYLTATCDATCPTAREYPALVPERIAEALVRRRRLLAASPRLIAVSPSRWLADTAQRALWRGRRVEVIPNGIPLDVYAPSDRSSARRRLGIPAEAPVVLSVAVSHAERRKGADLLEAALERVGRPITWVTLGSAAPAPSRGTRIRHVALGDLADPGVQALVYGAADVLIHPAREDNLPNVIVEALACGTPAIAFRVGGVPELVRPGQTGWLVEPFDVAALARTIEGALLDGGAGALRDRCRAVATAEYGAPLQAERYTMVFRDLTGA